MYLFVKIRNNFLQSVVDFEPESIHELRVGIKQLRSLFRLIEWMQPDFKFKANYRKVRQLFKAAGPLRDLQVQQTLAQAWQLQLNFDLSSYLALLQSREVTARVAYGHTAQKFKIMKLKKKSRKIENWFISISRRDVKIQAKVCVQNQMSQILQLGENPSEARKHLHPIRILSKEIRYTLEFLTVCLPDLHYPKQLQQGLKNVHQIIGQWHDQEIALQFFQNHGSEFSPEIAAGATQITQLCQRIILQKEILVVAFEKIWQKILPFLRKYSA
jgi:CHAD domain-containing protein